MKKISLMVAVLTLCACLASCKEVNASASNGFESTTPHDAYEIGTSTESTEDTVADEIPFPEDSVADTEPMTDEPVTDIPVESESISEETQIDNILKLPLLDDKIKGYVYLTIDDGPSDKTGMVLDILEEYNVKASFFFVGVKMNNKSDEVFRAFQSGHDIGCHSMTHDYWTIYESGQAISEDIAAWENAVEAIIGEIPEYRIYRFPGGTTNTVIIDNYAELKTAVSGKGYRSFDWNCANCDKWLVPKPEDQSFEDYLKSSVISSLQTARGPKVMLIHETVKETVDMLPWIFEYIRSEGYEFALLSDFDGEYVFRK